MKDLIELVEKKKTESKIQREKATLLAKESQEIFNHVASLESEILLLEKFISKFSAEKPERKKKAPREKNDLPVTDMADYASEENVTVV